MNYILVILFILTLLFYKKQGFMTLETNSTPHEFTRANSYIVSDYASNTYPCLT